MYKRMNFLIVLVSCYTQEKCTKYDIFTNMALISYFVYCKFENFREGFISQNLAYVKFRENEILAQGRNHFVIY